VPMKKQLKAARTLLRPFAPALRFTFGSAARCCLALNKVVGWGYLKLWPILGVYWYDHVFDHLLGPGWNRWTERGTLANRCIRPGHEVLDIACGDGSFSGNYYSANASHVDAFDYDEKAIKNAKSKYAKHNITFFVADATTIELQPRKYDVIAFFVAIEHFSKSEGTKLIAKLASALKPGGVLIGSTPIFTEVGGHNEEHQNEFLSVNQLRKFVNPHFNQVDLWCSNWPGRTECYFECRLPNSISDARPIELGRVNSTAW
jgi:ubiquinone/menaquinone biosynthesis C-methylase UbiE